MSTGESGLPVIHVMLWNPFCGSVFPDRACPDSHLQVAGCGESGSVTVECMEPLAAITDSVFQGAEQTWRLDTE